MQKGSQIIAQFLVVVLTMGTSLVMAHTAADREALFDYLLEKTEEREAWSPPKNEKLNINWLNDAELLRDDFVNADSDQDLYRMLWKLCLVRKDAHLNIETINGGISGNEDETETVVRFAPDYGPTDTSFFVADLATNISTHTSENIGIGDKVISVNGTPMEEYFEQLAPWQRYSTRQALMWKVAMHLSMKSNHYDPALYDGNNVTYVLEPRGGGAQYTVTLPYLNPGGINWQEIGSRTYPGFEKIGEGGAYGGIIKVFDLYKKTSGRKVALINWYMFQSTQSMANQIVSLAKQHDLLDGDVIVDMTHANGGSESGFLVQILTDKPFQATLGNVRISDILPEFTASMSGDAPVHEWLSTDVADAAARGDEYSANVPFKLDYGSKTDDGILNPAAERFTGNVVCLFFPIHGSNLDQFAAMMIDNDMGHSIGQSAGGYSNTWEWQENVVFPTNNQPVAEWEWNIGHTIRPNGEVLEGNPPEAEEVFTMRADNYETYFDDLVARALAYLDNPVNSVKKNNVNSISSPIVAVTHGMGNDINVSFNLPRAGAVKLSIFDAQGKELVTIMNRIYFAGKHSIFWDQSSLSQGTYFVKLSFLDKKSHSDFSKFIIVK